jgi:hypothetical protein
MDGGQKGTRLPDGVGLQKVCELAYGPETASQAWTFDGHAVSEALVGQSVDLIQRLLRGTHLERLNKGFDLGHPLCNEGDQRRFEHSQPSVGVFDALPHGSSTGLATLHLEGRGDHPELD